jgi:hypothetical protein
LRLYSFFALVVGEVAPKKMAGAVTKACSPAPIMNVHERISFFCNKHCNLNDREKRTQGVNISRVITTLDFFAYHSKTRDKKRSLIRSSTQMKQFDL